MGAIDGTTMGLSEGGCRRSRIETLECRRFDPGGVGKLQRMPVKERSINPAPEPPSGEVWLVNDQQKCSVQFKSVAPPACQALPLAKVVSSKPSNTNRLNVSVTLAGMHS